jgi:hypothetical protein
MPLENKLVFALISGYGLKKYNNRYRDVKIGYVNKDLIKPIPGRYQFNDLDPLSSDKSFFPVFTDKNGTVTFPDMYFSIYGPAGEIIMIDLT